MAIRLDVAEQRGRQRRQKASSRHRIRVSGTNLGLVLSPANTEFIPSRSKLVDHCIHCGRSFTEAERKITRGKERVRRTNQCVDCWKQSAKSNNVRRRKLWNAFKRLLIKRNGGCSDCGILELGHPCIYAFHHRDPAIKEGHLSTIGGAGYNLSNKKLFLQEAKKCEILCRNCHAIRHEGENL